MATRIRGLHHIAIPIRDRDETRTLYEDVLGYNEKLGWDFPGGRARYLEAQDGSGIEFFEFDDSAASSQYLRDPIMHFCVITDDFDAVYAKLKALGTKIIRETYLGKIKPAGFEDVPLRVCFFEGPNGEVIEFKETP